MKSSSEETGPFICIISVMHVMSGHEIKCTYSDIVLYYYRDLPDVEGDTVHNINTFASQRGVGNAALVATVVLGLNYMSAIVEAMSSPGVCVMCKVIKDTVKDTTDAAYTLCDGMTDLSKSVCLIYYVLFIVVLQLECSTDA